MSERHEHAQLAAVAQEVAAARSRLTEDIAALAYVMSPAHIKQEAIDVVSQAALDTKAALTRWGGQALVVAPKYWSPATATLGFGGLLYAARGRRSVPLLLGALTCGVAAFVLARRITRRRSLPPQLPSPATKGLALNTD